MQYFSDGHLFWLDFINALSTEDSVFWPCIFASGRMVNCCLRHEIMALTFLMICHAANAFVVLGRNEYSLECISNGEGRAWSLLFAATSVGLLPD